MSGSGIFVTVDDTVDGRHAEVEIPMDDYLILACGSCTYEIQAYANGTHVITVKGRKPGGAS